VDGIWLQKTDVFEAWFERRLESELMAESVPLRILVADWILSNIQIRDSSYTPNKAFASLG
jgi:hypothetical protein